MSTNYKVHNHYKLLFELATSFNVGKNTFEEIDQFFKKLFELFELDFAASYHLNDEDGLLLLKQEYQSVRLINIDQTFSTLETEQIILELGEESDIARYFEEYYLGNSTHLIQLKVSEYIFFYLRRDRPFELKEFEKLNRIFFQFDAFVKRGIKAGYNMFCEPLRLPARVSEPQVLLVKGRIVDVNQGFAKLLGYSKIDLLGSHIKNYILKEDYPQQQLSSQLTQEHNTLLISDRMIHKSGNIIHTTKLMVGRYNHSGGISSILVNINDVTKVAEIEDQIHEREAVLNAILDSSLDNIIMLDLEGKIMFANQTVRNNLLRLFDYKVAVGDMLVKTVPFEVRENFEKTINKTLAGEIIEFEHVIKFEKSQNDKSYLSFSCIPVKIGNNKILGCLIAIRNITKERVNEISLQTREAALQSIIESSPDNILVLDKDLGVMYANQGSADAFKKNYNILLQKNISVFDQINSREGEKYNALCHRALKGEKITIEYESMDQSGEHKLYSLVSFAPLYSLDQEINGVVTVARNITELKEKSKLLAEQKATLNAVFDATYDGIYAVDKSFNVIAVNRQAIYDFKHQIDMDIEVGKNIKELAKPHMFKRWEKIYFSRIFRGESFDWQGEVKDLAGNKFHVLNRYAPVRDENGSIIGALEISQNISDLINQELKIKRSESKYKNLVESSPMGILTVNAAEEFSFISKRGAQLLRVNPEEIINKKVSSVVKESYISAFKNLVQQNQSQQIFPWSIYDYEYNGNIYYIDSNVRLIYDKEGNHVSTLFVFSDVSDRIKTERALKSAQMSYSKMFENSFNPIVLYNIKSNRILNFNRAAMSMFVLENHQLRDIPRTAFFDDKELDKIDKAYQTYTNKLNRNNEFKGVKLRSKIKLPNKKEYIVDLNIIQSNSEDEVIVVVNDKTKEILANKELSKANEVMSWKNFQYETVLENSFDGIDITSYNVENDRISDGKILVRNTNMKKYFPDDSKLYDNIKDIMTISPQYQNGTRKSEVVIREILTKVLRGHEVELEYRFEYPNGEVIDILSKQKLIRFQKNVLLIRAFSDITNITEQRTIIQNQLKDLNDKNIELERYINSNLQLENFAYIASHDLKAPLRSVKSFAELLKGRIYSDLDDKSKKYLDIVLHSSTDMQILIDDLLAYSRVNTESLKLKEVNLDKLMRRVIINLNSSIEETDARITFERLPEIIADESMMFQIFSNLISNAIKFVKKGKQPIINIGFYKKEAFYQFVIEDNGIGIEEKNIRQIFNTFEKLHSNDIYEGTGLGLTICKKIAENHGGKIWVESKPGIGSQFNFSISSELLLTSG